jgi:hypothetical protein
MIRSIQKDGVDGPNGIDVPKCGLSEPATREPPAMSISMIGLDTAKSVFQIHGVNKNVAPPNMWRIVYR